MWWVRYPVKREVIVNTKTDVAFRGILWQRRWGLYVLRKAQMLRDRGEPVTMDGDVVIQATNVDFIQVVA